MDRRRAPVTSRWSAALLVAPVAFLLCFFAWPVANIVGEGLRADHGWDLSGVEEVLGDPGLRQVAWFTVWQAAASTALTLAIGLPAAHVLSTFDFRGRAVLQARPPQRPVEPRPRRGGRDRDGHAPVPQRPHRLQRVRERDQLAVDEREQRRRVVLPERARIRQPVDPLREVPVDPGVGQPDQPRVLLVADRVAVRPERPLPRGPRERLGVDERAVAVEDDGLDRHGRPAMMAGAQPVAGIPVRWR